MRAPQEHIPPATLLSTTIVRPQYSCKIITESAHCLQNTMPCPPPSGLQYSHSTHTVSDPFGIPQSPRNTSQGHNNPPVSPQWHTVCPQYPHSRSDHDVSLNELVSRGLMRLSSGHRSDLLHWFWGFCGFGMVTQKLGRFVSEPLASQMSAGHLASKLSASRMVSRTSQTFFKHFRMQQIQKKLKM